MSVSSGGKRSQKKMHNKGEAMQPQRKVSMERGCNPNPNLGGMPPSMADMNMHQMHMHEMMMMEYGMMGGGVGATNPYDVGHLFMPMHPSEAASMGPMMMDQMMDFPPARIMSPMARHPNSRQPPLRNPMLPDLRGGSARNGYYSNNNELDQFQHLASAHNASLSQQQQQQQQYPRTMMHNGSLSGGVADTLGPPMLFGDSDLIAGGCNNNNSDNKRKPSTTSFPSKLYKILADPQYAEYIAWLPHGRAWRVIKPKSLEEDVIPKFFRSDRYSSFMRQVRVVCPHVLLLLLPAIMIA